MQLAKDVGIPDSDILKWDIEETKKGTRKFVSCVDVWLTWTRRSLPGNR